MSSKPRYLAMWSGPRNISTAMMRAWGNRSDTSVIDEPFYAWYLAQTGRLDPGRDDILASQPQDWEAVVRGITGDIPGGRAVYYQKHITTHMLPQLPLNWLAQLDHCFLIRDPAAVVASYTDKRPDGSASDLGYEQQFRIYSHVRDTLKIQPPVIDSAQFLQDPEAHLRSLCAHFELPFEASMLSWEPGIRDTDGVWHTHWYANVEKSTGFGKPSQRDPQALDEQQQAIVAACEPFYRQMLAETESFKRKT